MNFSHIYVELFNNQSGCYDSVKHQKSREQTQTETFAEYG